MDAQDQEIFDNVVELLKPFNTENIELTPETDISGDLNIDSVSVMDFVMEIEDKFDIDIPLNLLSETRTISEMIDVVKSRAKG
ncbi:MAG: acyl carrier protein [Hyphomicrobiales bacterium]